ncbi:MAG: NAD(P)-dependent alcohol dehydrogenase [Thermodesulfobacteriota bacterium]|nr:NAD(P)-dependent alcohol dehydrogenase [Thermodesulfobacteriota bacterium]
MKAFIYTKYGPPDVLQLIEMKKPVPKDDEVLIKIFATTVNRTDCAILLGKPFIMRFVTGLFRPKSLITGTDFAGKVEAVGKHVTSFHVGDRVWGFNDNGLGSHAHYMTISENKAITTIPSNITYEQAAASAEGAHYAYNFIKKVNLRSGHKILVNGATGAIGSAAVQFLRFFGAHITAVCGAKHIELVKSLGANRVFDYINEDFTQDDQKYNFVFDTVGKSSFAKCKPLLHSGGVYISSELGYMGQNLFLALITPIIGNKKVIFPFPTDIKGSIHFVKNLIEEEQFKPLIDRNYPLEKIDEAYRYVATGQKIGNVVITVDDNNETLPS